MRIANALEWIADALDALASQDVTLRVSVAELADCIADGGGRSGTESAVRVYGVHGFTE